MCGIVGFSGKGLIDLSKLRVLLTLNDLERGKDSTGVYSPKNGLVKDTLTAYKAFQTEPFQNLKRDNVFISHVRKASVGGSTLSASHPYEYDNIVGVHNGTLTNHYQLASKNLIPHMSWTTDSQVLYKVLDKNMEDPQTMFKVLEEYEGAAALLFYSKERGTIFACHDSKRPLFYGYDQKNNMYISSVAEALETVGLQSITEFPVNIIHEIDRGVIINTVEYTPGKGNITVNTTIKNITRSLPTMSTTFSDMVIDDQGYVSGVFSDNFTGVISFWSTPNIAKIAIGFNIRTNNVLNKHTSGVHEELINLAANTPMLVVGVDIARSSFIVEYKKKRYTLGFYIFRTDNFIPIKGNFGTLIADVFMSKSGQLAGNLDDVVEFNWYNPETKTVSVYNEYTDMSFTIPTNLLMISTDREISEHVEALKYLYASKAAKSPEEEIAEIVNPLINPPLTNIEEMSYLDDDVESEGDLGTSYVLVEDVDKILQDIKHRIATMVESDGTYQDILLELRDLYSLVESVKPSEFNQTF